MTPRPLSRRVLVEHATTGVRKHVLRSQLSQLSTVWRRVPTMPTSRKTKTSKERPDTTSAPASIEEN